MTHLGLRSVLETPEWRMSLTEKERTRVMEALFRAHRLLCSRFVSEERFRAAFGAPRADMNATAQYLALPPAQRPVLSLFFDAAYYRAQLGDGLAESDDPLLHFLEHGLPALRSPHPLIDLRYVVSRDPLLLGEVPSVDGVMDLLDHDLADPGPYFELDFYAPQRGEARGASLQDFLSQGAQRVGGPRSSSIRRGIRRSMPMCPPIRGWRRGISSFLATGRAGHRRRRSILSITANATRMWRSPACRH